MRSRATTIGALVIWGIGTLLVIGGILLLFLNRSTWVSPFVLYTDAFSVAVGGLCYTTVGAFLFARFPRNAITWIFWATGLMFAYLFFANEYAIYGLVVAPGRLPAAAWVYWLAYPLTILAFPSGFGLLVLLFPDGRLPARAWMPVLVLELVLAAVLVLYSIPPVAVTRALLGSVPMTVAWPDGLASLASITSTRLWKAVVQVVLVVSALGQLVTVLGGLAAFLWRLRRASGPERQQLKWLAYIVAGTTVGLVVSFVGEVAAPDRYAAQRSLTLAGIGSIIWITFATVGIPVTTLIAITRHRLYDIDLVIKKTLVYGFLAIVITGIYALVVVTLGSVVGGPERFGLSLLATALIAIAFQPLRARAQRVANRLVYGRRATPYEALSQLNEQIAGTYGGEEILNRMTRILAKATGAERAELWVKRGQELVRTSAWPEAASASYALSDGRLPEMAADKVLPVTHKGQLLGALALTKKRGESLTPLEEKLLADLASQAGLVLENAGLNQELLARLEELQASRQRLVTAQDEERRRIERNLHDGAQQQVVALTVRLALLERLVAKDPEKAKTMAFDLRQSAGEALETLRELAHGIYPPLLASDGLATALQQQVRRSPVPIDVDVRDIPRQSKEVEAAIYFCCLEALQNIAKHAGATRARIRLWADDQQLHLAVEDGRGFDPGVNRSSTGLQNMRDRVQALGGTLEVRSRPGDGTTIVGSTPLLQ
jgi:signal transduction histidine kinase